jgi:hypothetical protein
MELLNQWTCTFFSQRGCFQKHSILAVRSGDESIFWLARCIDDVSEFQPRWLANYFSLSVSRDEGDDEYIMCATTDFIWRDVVLADITNSVRVVGKKVWLSSKLKHELKSCDPISGTSPVEAMPPVETPMDMIDTNTLEQLRSKTHSARKIVSRFHLSETFCVYIYISRCISKCMSKCI